MKAEVLKGQAVYEDIVFGKLRFYEKETVNIPNYEITDIKKEIARYEKAKKITVKQLHSLYEEAKRKIMTSAAMIFEIHRMILEDDDYCGGITDVIKNEHKNSEYAIDSVTKNYCKIFSDLDDEYMRQRADDIREVANRLIYVLQDEENINEDIPNWDNPVILASSYFDTGETIKLDKNKVLALATQRGSKTSHMAILSKTMGIPAVVGIGKQLNSSLDGCQVILDSFTGELYINPDKLTEKKLKIKKFQKYEKNKSLYRLKGKPNITKDGKNIAVNADMGNINDPSKIDLNEINAIGLLRTEYLFSGYYSAPSENEQFRVYKEFMNRLNGKKCIIRTFDIDSCGKFPFVYFAKEKNPALGMRSVRVYFEYPELFKTQMRALLKAAVWGNVEIVIPFITSLRDIQRVKKLINECKDELRHNNIPFNDNIPVGILIETPAAVMLCSELAKEVDFLLIGTNDLAQYTFATDRQNMLSSEYVKDSKIAFLRMIKLVRDSTVRNNTPLGICGELASDEDLIKYYLAMGIDQLTVSVKNVLNTRATIRNINISKIKDKLLSEI